MDREGLFLVANSSTPINGGKVWRVSNKWGHNGAGTSPGIISFPICGVGDVNRVEEWMRGVVGDETSWRDGILVLGRFVVDL